ncbi:MAG: helix-turn-helix domain-containing protein [Dehalococcoidia bacterium]|nr:helix-turn-helix domain-containing protein [Dehalococcoidia bacterium]
MYKERDGNHRKDRSRGEVVNNLLTVREASRLLNVHSNTLRRWGDSGMIKVYRIGVRGDRRFKQEDIKALLTERTKFGRFGRA